MFVWGGRSSNHGPTTLTSVTIIRKSRISNSLESWKQYKSYVEKPEYFQGSINPLHSKTHLNPIKYHDQMKKNNIYAHINALGDFIAKIALLWYFGFLVNSHRLAFLSIRLQLSKVDHFFRHGSLECSLFHFNNIFDMKFGSKRAC